VLSNIRFVIFFIYLSLKIYLILFDVSITNMCPVYFLYLSVINSSIGFYPIDFLDNLIVGTRHFDKYSELPRKLKILISDDSKCFDWLYVQNCFGPSTYHYKTLFLFIYGSYTRMYFINK